MFVTKDNGRRQEWFTGSKRDTRDGKGRFDLLPAGALKRLAQLYERGANKYGDRNWEKGQPLSRYLDSAMRHITDYLAGDREEDHIIAAAWNCLGFVQTEIWIAAGRLPAELDDLNPRPDTEPPEAQREPDNGPHTLVSPRFPFEKPSSRPTPSVRVVSPGEK